MKPILKIVCFLSAFLSFKADAQRLYGLLNSRGEVVVPAIYSAVGHTGFQHGLLLVQKDNLWGAVDTMGKVVVPIIYNNIRSVWKDYVTAEKAGVQYLIRTGGGEKAFPANYKDLRVADSMLVAVVRNESGVDECTCMKLDGTVVFKTPGNCYNAFSEGLMSVASNNKYGFINREGKLVYPYRITSYNPEFRTGVATVSVGDSNFLLTRKMELRFIGTGIQVYGTADGMIPFKKDGLIGFFNTEGKEVISPRYQSFSSFEKGYATAKRNEQVYLIDNKGNELRNLPGYHDFPVSEGLVRFDVPGGQGFMDLQGQQVLPASARYESNLRANRIIFSAEQGTNPSSLALLSNPWPQKAVAQSNAAATASPATVTAAPSTTTTASTAPANTLKPYSSSSSVSRDIFNTKGSMVIYSGSNMLVWKITGSKAVDAKLVAARCADSYGIRKDYKYQHFAGYSCDNLKNTYNRQFSVSCQGEVSTD